MTSRPLQLLLFVCAGPTGCISPCPAGYLEDYLGNCWLPECIDDAADTGDTGGTTAGDSAVLDDGDYEVYGLWYWPDSEYGVQGWESLELSLDSPHLTGGW